MKATLDVAAVEAGGRAVLAALNAAIDGMQPIVAAKAAEERATHVYQNRTGLLEASTTATPLVKTPDGATVEFREDTDYAEYLRRRGGWTRIDELAGEATAEIAALFERVGK